MIVKPTYLHWQDAAGNVFIVRLEDIAAVDGSVNAVHLAGGGTLSLEHREFQLVALKWKEYLDFEERK